LVSGWGRCLSRLERCEGLEQAVQGRQEIAGCHGWLIIEGRRGVPAGDLTQALTWPAQLADREKLLRS
jgi:hypothetical protein